MSLRGDIMSIREDIELYTKLSGEDASQETIATIGAYLRGYRQGKEDAEPHWIPVTERLPEINEDIMLSYFDEVTIGWLNSDGSWSIFDGQECASADEISAWMPLPTPWKGR